MNTGKQTARSLKGDSMLVLKAIEANPMCHGFALPDIIAKATNGEIELGEAAVYPALRLLEGKNLIVGEWDLPTSGVPRKKYVITELGKKELKKCMTLAERYQAMADALRSNLHVRDN